MSPNENQVQIKMGVQQSANSERERKVSRPAKKSVKWSATRGEERVSGHSGEKLANDPGWLGGNEKRK